MRGPNCVAPTGVPVSRTTSRPRVVGGGLGPRGRPVSVTVPRPETGGFPRSVSFYGPSQTTYFSDKPFEDM